MPEVSSDESDNSLRLHISDFDGDSLSENEGSDSDGSSLQDGGDCDAENEFQPDDDDERVHSDSGKPMSSEWVEFNKKVVSMRSLFKSAKVQFIHKSTRTIKNMRKKKGTPEQIDKNQKKADRFVQEIAYINKLKKDVIAKFALLHSKEEISKIISSPESTMEYRVKAKVAAMPMISKVADAYHEEHPDWRETLFKLIQIAGKTMKKKRRKLRGNNKKSSNKQEDVSHKVKKKPSEKRRKINEEDDGSDRFGSSNFPEPPPGIEEMLGRSGSSDEGSSNDGTESTQASDDEPSSEEPGALLKISKDILEKSSLQSNKLQPKLGEQRKTTERISEEMGEKKRKHFEVNDRIGSSEKVKIRKKDTKSMKEETFESQSKTSSLESLSHESSSDSDEKNPSNVDPFFMTSDNKEYKSHWKVEPADSHKNKSKNEPEFMFKNARPFQDSKRGKNDKGSNAKDQRLNRKDKKSLGGGSQAAPSLESLHPSWQAKKKMSTSGVSFQGKKIVFGDD